VLAYSVTTVLANPTRAAPAGREDPGRLTPRQIEDGPVSCGNCGAEFREPGDQGGGED